MGGDCSASELPESKPLSLFLLPNAPQSIKLLLGFFCSSHSLSFLFPPSAKLVFKAAAMVSLLF